MRLVCKDMRKQMNKELDKVIKDIKKIQEIADKYDFVQLELVICDDCLHEWIDWKIEELKDV